MKSLLIRIYLTLCIFLLGAYKQSHASTLQGRASFNLTTNFGVAHLQQLDPSIVKPTPAFEKDDKVDFTDNESENEEDDITSLKKSFEAANYFSSVFFSHSPNYFSHCIKSRLPFSKHFINFPPQRRFIIFRVIRI
ncbi:hypothetical protein [Flavobacterium rhizosphaerae]|uniref:Uncharacterized protein n=1 Tax=Flavobacterium rhizosphaerae TaxID=3163298 RepID=A0ABW8YRG6_9FLAO